MGHFSIYADPEPLEKYHRPEISGATVLVIPDSGDMIEVAIRRVPDAMHHTMPFCGPVELSLDESADVLVRLGMMVVKGGIL